MLGNLRLLSMEVLGDWDAFGWAEVLQLGDGAWLVDVRVDVAVAFYMAVVVYTRQLASWLVYLKICLATSLDAEA